MLDVFRRKLPRSALLWFTAAGLAAGGAALAAQSHIAAIEARHPDVGAPTPVVVAASDLVRGATLDPHSLRLIDMPSTLVPPGAVTAIEGVSGRVLGADLAEGEVLTETRFAARGAGPVAALVPAGMRAFVLPAGPPEGSLRSGDEIDVLATYGANAGRPYTETVATGVEVLDVIESDAPVTTGVAGASTGPPVVILTDPLTVERLARASSLALLSISIVGDDDAVSSTGDPSALG
ncbi:MAG TPA: Flp pilus assembly protein CpaB [Actinomycetota bacterium]